MEQSHRRFDVVAPVPKRDGGDDWTIAATIHGPLDIHPIDRGVK